MKKRKVFISAVCIILVVMMVLSITVMVVAPSAYAATSTQIQAELDQLNNQKSEIQGRMDQLQSEIDSLDFEKANTLEKKEYLDRKNQLAQEELNVIQEQVEIIDGKIDSIQADLEDARKEEQVQRDRWLARLRAMEESSGIGYMEVLFNATSFSDLLTRLDLVNEVMAYDEQLEDEYIAARENVEALEAEAETMYTENALRRQELETKQNQLAADITAACALVEQMDQDSDDYKAVLAQEAETQAQVQELIVQKEKDLQEARVAEEAARLAALAAQRPASSHSNQVTIVSDSSTDTQTGDAGQSEGTDGSGQSSGASDTSGTWMMWPSYTTSLNDSYGMRTNPVSGEYKMHNGVDVNASNGSSIYAAAGGTVIKAGEYGGYGNCVMVNHGNGYTTLYGHMSSISVSEGQTVSQGEVLGLVGSTGNSTGPHLHFEVRASATGETMDPQGFSYF